MPSQEITYPDLVDVILQAVRRRLVEIQRKAWQREFRLLQKQIRAAGGFGLGETKDEIISNLREVRRQVFEEEYAHLY